MSQFYSHCNKSPGDRVESEDIERYLKLLAKRREDWQVKQASEAIELHLFFRRKKQATRNGKLSDVNEQWKSVDDDMKKMLRLKHLSFRTERTYLGWVRRFYHFLNGQLPNKLDSTQYMIKIGKTVSRASIFQVLWNESYRTLEKNGHGFGCSLHTKFRLTQQPILFDDTTFMLEIYRDRLNRQE